MAVRNMKRDDMDDRDGLVHDPEVDLDAIMGNEPSEDDEADIGDDVEYEFEIEDFEDDDFDDDEDDDDFGDIEGDFFEDYDDFEEDDFGGDDDEDDSDTED